MNLLRVLLRSVCGSHPSDVPPKSKISVQIEQNGNGRRSGAFLHISFKNSSICKAFGVRQRPPQGAEFVCVPCGANNSKSTASDGVPVRVRPPAPNFTAVILLRGHSGVFFISGLAKACPSLILTSRPWGGSCPFCKEDSKSSGVGPIKATFLQLS